MPHTDYKALCAQQRKEIKALKALVGEMALLLCDRDDELEPEWVYAADGQTENQSQVPVRALEELQPE